MTKYAWELDARILGWMWIALGIILILETPIFMKFSNAAAGVSVIFEDIAIALVYWGRGGSLMWDISGWAFLVAAMGGILNAADDILRDAGWSCHLGHLS